MLVETREQPDDNVAAQRTAENIAAKCFLNAVLHR
jgi:hypothetical protein